MVRLVRAQTEAGSKGRKNRIPMTPQPHHLMLAVV
uniref:Uncharacterized protein n=1 Tax=Arundo donax TaxID=35708 RepID=A0A0A9BF38_ARUDO